MRFPSLICLGLKDVNKVHCAWCWNAGSGTQSVSSLPGDLSCGDGMMRNAIKAGENAIWIDFRRRTSSGEDVWMERWVSGSSRTELKTFTFGRAPFLPLICWYPLSPACVSCRSWIHVPLGDGNALFCVNIQWVFRAALLSLNLPPRALHTDRRLSAQIHAQTCRVSVCFRVWAVISARLPP